MKLCRARVYCIAAEPRYNGDVKLLHAALTAIALSILTLASAAALEAPVAIRPTWGVVIESLLDPSLSTPGATVRVPTPSINFNLGCGVIMPFNPDSHFSFEPSADFYYYNAEYTTSGQVVPTAEEQSSAFVLGLLLDSPVSFSLPVGRNFTFGVGIGLCLDLRVAFTTDPTKAGNTPLMNRFLWDKARFLMPSTRIRGEYALTERVKFGFTGRVLWPVFNLWAGEGFGFFDQGEYLVDLTIRYKLGKIAATQPEEAAAPSPPDAANP